MKPIRALHMFILGCCIIFLGACGGVAPNEPSETEIRMAVQNLILGTELTPMKFVSGTYPGNGSTASFDEFEVLRISNYNEASSSWTAEIKLRGTVKASSVIFKDDVMRLEIEDAFRIFKNDFDEWDASNSSF